MLFKLISIVQIISKSKQNGVPQGRVQLQWRRARRRASQRICFHKRFMLHCRNNSDYARRCVRRGVWLNGRVHDDKAHTKEDGDAGDQAVNSAFDSQTNRLIQSEDGSCTAYSVRFDEHYHSTKDGALNESLKKHVIPAISMLSDKEELCILDICFGLGFNTLATLYYLKEQGLKTKVRIVSPEMDEELVRSLRHFTYPEIFKPFLPIVHAISETLRYDDESVSIEVIAGDARAYLKSCTEKFDIVYQDAFSPSANPALWTTEYFADISRLICDDGIVTTYSTALKTRLALYENGFNVYVNSGESFRDATVASKKDLTRFSRVDMGHKIRCNPDVAPLHDADLD